MKLILYFADGFAWQYVEDRRFMTRFWDERRPLTTLLGYSSTIIPAILTGRLPSETDMWTEYYLEPRERSALQRLLTRPRLRFLLFPANLMRLVWFRIARRLGFAREHRLRLPLELSHLFARHPIDYESFPPIGLGVPTLAELFEERGLRVDFRYLKGGGDPAAELARLDAVADDFDVFFYYDTALDGHGHQVGASADGLAADIERIEGFVESAWTRLSADHEVELLMFSDHGMTDVESTFDLFEHLGDLRLGVDYLVFMDSTIARFWFPSPEAREEILGRLDGVPGRLLSREEEREYGIDFGHDRYAQDVLVANEGVVFHPNYFAGPFIRLARTYPEKAMHGYLPDAPSSRGVFFYRGTRQSDFPEPLLPTDVFKIVDNVTAAEVYDRGAL